MRSTSEREERADLAAQENERNRIIDAFRNCITEPKCKDCPWTECSTLNNGIIEVPKDLALAVMRELVDGDKRRWTPFKTRPLTHEEKKQYPSCVEFIENFPVGESDEADVLISDGKMVWADTFVDDFDSCYLDSGRKITEGMAWMYLPEPYKEAEDV